ncbi:glycosyltransferase family 4 protein, partial [Candidatus Poribacteria bacterium]|nr:glycosyltransferase family 4 protein [Candidatus Poribacteria bacterium]
NRKPKLLVPFHFTKEKTSLDYVTNLNRYQLLIHLAKAAELETLTFSEAGKTDLKPEDLQGLGEIQIRNIAVEESDAFSPPWYAMDGYDGMLLLSQFMTDDLLYYQVPNVPIVHCIDDIPKFQGSTLETLLNICAFQNVGDTLVVKASWIREWLMERGFSGENIHVVPNGINVGEPIGKPLAKQHTAALFEKPIFAQQPIVGLISGFEPNYGARLISAFARANPHLAIFVYDPFLAEYYTNPPSNVVIFSVDDNETHSILPIFFQTLDLVCFPAIPGTPLSLVLEAMAYGTPCVAMTTYGLPPEVAGAGAVVKPERRGFGDFCVPMSELSQTIDQLLKPSQQRIECENAAKNLVQKFTWEQVAQEIIESIEEGYRRSVNAFRRGINLSPSVFCHRYNPRAGTTESSAYRVGTHRYSCLKTALIEMLAEQHTPAEVEAVFKHFQGKGFISVANEFVLEMGLPTNVGGSILPE